MLYICWYIYIVHIPCTCTLTLYNQPAETYLKTKKFYVAALNIHLWSDLAIVVCFVLDIYIQNHIIYLRDEERNFNGIPLIILGTRVLDTASSSLKELRNHKQKLFLCPPQK